MASTYTTQLRLTKQADGEQNTTWGSTLNTQVIDLVDTAISGATTLTLASSDVTLTMDDGSNGSNNGRSAFLRLLGTLTANVQIIVPDLASGSPPGKKYIVLNGTTGNFTVTIKTVSSSGVIIPSGQSVSVWVDTASDVVRLCDSISRGLSIPVTSFSATSLSITRSDVGESFIFTGSTATTVSNDVAVANFFNGFSFFLRNSGTAACTFNPDGVETINGASSFTLLPGDSCLIFTDGTAWFTGSTQRAFHGFLLSSNANQSTATGVQEDVDWQTEHYDTFAFHAGVATTVTVPTGVTRMRLSAAITFAAATDATRRLVRIQKNAADIEGGGVAAQPAIATAGISTVVTVTGGVVACVAGDTFSVAVLQASAGALDVQNSANTWFAGEVVW